MEGIQQRKQLFSHKAVDTPNTVTTTSTFWKQSTFSGDEDGKLSAKFRRLMGMKDDDASSSAVAETLTGKESDPLMKDQEKLLTELEKQYEVARRVTHSQKGLGLGFGPSS